jgi:hypothetical protein
MRRGLLLHVLLGSTAAALTLAVPTAEPATRPARFLLALTAGGSVSLLRSSDGVRFAPVPGYAPGPATSAAPVRRGSTLYLYDTPALSADGLEGGVRRFAIGAGGRLAEQAPASYRVELASPEDAQRASPGSFAPSVAVDDAGALGGLYALRLEPGAHACPVAGQACVKLRTATEVAGSDGTAFAGDPGNRAVLSFAPADSLGPPALLRADRGWAALLQGPAGCLHVVTAADPHAAYRNAGCAAAQGPASPSGLWDARLREYRLYGVAGGRVVRAVSTRLARIAPTRFRPLAALGAQASTARVAANAP